MRQNLLLMSAALAAVGVGVGVGIVARSNGATREVRIVGGRTALRFTPSAMEENHLAIDLKYPEGIGCGTCEAPTLPVKQADLLVKVKNGKFARVEGGKIAHDGSLKLTSGNKVIDVADLTISANRRSKSGLSLVAKAQDKTIVAFDLASPKGLYRANADELVLEDLDVLIGEGLAEELGRPDLAGEPIGKLSVFGEQQEVDGGGELVEVSKVPTSPQGGLDVSLFSMGNLAVATSPTGRVGTYPNGRNGLTMTTTACNVGTVNIPWNAPMQVTHPVIAMNLYRLMNGRFEQIGWSWLKHGFLATNSTSSGCAPCQHPGTGSLLGPGCSDTYGNGNNQDRTYLGGRDEVNPFTGVWTCQGSWFSNYVNDCTRRNPGAVTLDAVDHRLDVLDADLGNAGAQYFYEAYYILPNDINTYNNIASRQATMTWNGSAWTFSTTGAQVQGPAINRWGDLRTFAQPQTQGDVIVAVQVTPLGAGMWNYEYAIYNHNLDRQVREFSVPLPANATVSNIGFRDIDRTAGNDWTASVTPTAITWTSPAVGNPNANPLKYSSIFNFRFDSDIPPASTSTGLTLFKTGTPGALTAASRGPLVYDAPVGFTLVNSGQFSGNLASLAQSDNSRLELGPVDSGSRDGSGLIASFTAPAGSVSQLQVGVESNNTLTTGGGAQQTIALFNWVSQAWEVLDTRPATLADSVATINITTNPARFVNPSTREVQVRVLHSTNLGLAGNRWKVNFDQVGVHFN